MSDPVPAPSTCLQTLVLWETAVSSFKLVFRSTCYIERRTAALSCSLPPPLKPRRLIHPRRLSLTPFGPRSPCLEKVTDVVGRARAAKMLGSPGEDGRYMFQAGMDASSRLYRLYHDLTVRAFLN